MKIILNNKEEVFDAPQFTVNELLQAKKFTFKMLVIKVNGQLIKKSDYSSALINDGDDVMVLHLISGGWTTSIPEVRLIQLNAKQKSISEVH